MFSLDNLFVYYYLLIACKSRFWLPLGKILPLETKLYSNAISFQVSAWLHNF